MKSSAIGAGLFLFSGVEMGNILLSAQAYEKLLDIEYLIVIGRKNKTLSLTIDFDANHFFHLAGLQYLEDIPDILRSRRDVVFNRILAGSITPQQISDSSFYSIIQERVDYLALLESIFDDNKTVFKYNPKLEAFSIIQADFLMKNEIQSRNVFTFLSQNAETGNYYCRSFFPQIDKDYSLGQTSWTLLYKKKIKKSTGAETVLYDRLNK